MVQIARIWDRCLKEPKRILKPLVWDKPLEGKQVSADTSYYSVENLKACEKEKVDAYVPDQQFRKRGYSFQRC